MPHEPLPLSPTELCPAPRPPATCAGYFRMRWRGELPLARVFWNDMLLMGTLVNAATTLLAVFLLATGARLPLVALAHFAPLPFNVFWVVSVWRGAAPAGAATALAARVAALAWLLTVTVL